MTVSYPVFGFYADRFNKAKLAKVAITTLLTLTIGSLYIVYAKIPGILSTPLYHITAGIVMASYTSICQLFLINSFKETVRYSCFGVSYGIGMAVAATAPFLITFLMYGNNYITLIMLLASMGILAIFSVYGVEKLLFKTELCNKC